MSDRMLVPRQRVVPFFVLIASLNQQTPSYETIKKEEEAEKAARAPEIKALEEEMKPFTTESSELNKKIAEAEAELRKER